MVFNKLFSRDNLMSTQPANVSECAMRVIDRLQIYRRKETQVLGLAAAFVLLCEHIGARETDVFTAISNMRRDANMHPEFRAVQDYIKYEVK